MNIGIIGTGRLGICKALCLDKAGYKVYCYDVNHTYLRTIQNKTLETHEPEVRDMLKKSKLNICYELSEIILNCEIIFILVQTPSKNNGGYDHSYIDNVVNQCLELNKNNALINKKTLVISSTVMPEYCNSVACKLQDANFDVCYNPSLIAQGSIIHDLMNPNLVLIGAETDDVFKTLVDIHKSFIKNNASFHKLSMLEAEITKISINCFITAKIAFANMIGDLLSKKGLDHDSVLNAIGSDKRINNHYLKYGYGFGGPCFPRDNRALMCYANSQGFDFDLCRITDILNYSHLLYQFNTMKHNSDAIDFTYITYKDNSDILEESQKLKLANMLSDFGCNVIIKEREHIIDKLKSTYGNKFEYELLK